MHKGPLPSSQCFSPTALLLTATIRNKNKVFRQSFAWIRVIFGVFKMHSIMNVDIKYLKGKFSQMTVNS